MIRQWSNGAYGIYPGVSMLFLKMHENAQCFQKLRFDFNTFVLIDSADVTQLLSGLFCNLEAFDGKTITLLS